ncbi:M56 family metallopeptidase [Tenacibaculum aiptasiae]|uniref:M56 family metallopeptidase n=1 Tax=Tenacibaculum aiptasiae TaxID=426481 RepID=UPI00232F9673|nr:M56 family metallopeptidase [Tenacibaculum aiptasiae]
MINYIIQVILFQALFVAVYDFFLSKETFFSKNRWYLLSTSIVSFLLPLVKIPTIQKAVPVEYTIMLPEVVLSPQRVIEKAAWYQSIDYLDVLFWSGCFVFLIVFVIKLLRIVRLIIKHGIERRKTYKLVLLPKNAKAFSFFNYIFIGKEIPSDKQEKIIQHELVHSKQKHSIDLLFFEFLRILMWFNPMVYVYQNRISLVHEYISDEEVSKETLKENYINNLLSDVFQVESISFINQFYKHSLIKKRIIMIMKTESKQIKQLKYLLLIPLLASMVLYTACSANDKNIIGAKLESRKLYFDLDKEPSVSSSIESYMDIYLGTKTPDTKEYSINDLSEEEKAEYKELLSKPPNKSDVFSKGTVRFFEGDNGRKLLFYDMKGLIKSYKVNKRNTSLNNDKVPFSMLDKYPTFPGCEEGNKDCFNKSITRFIANNFDVSKGNNLGIKKGKTRIYVQFKIDKTGEITQINARAPHPELKQYAIEVVEKLPKMKPGEKNGKIVATGYTLPISLNIE